MTTIGMSAFSGCSGLTSITIPSSVTYIGETAFQNCTGLTCVIYNATNCSIYTGTSSGAKYSPFYGCSQLKTLKIGETVETIANCAFICCTGLSELIICDSPNVLNIGENAFLGCPIETLYLGRNIEYESSLYLDIDKPFDSSISSVTIGALCSSIPKSTFYNCPNLKELYILDSSTTLRIAPSGYSSGYKSGHFYDSPLQKVYLGRNISWTSEASPFYPKTTLTELAIGDSVTTIPEKAFWGCSELTSVTIPKKVEYIGARAFEVDTVYFNAENCVGGTYSGSGNAYGPFGGYNLKSIKIGDSVKCISKYMFNCSTTDSIIIPNSVQEIQSLAFGNNSVLKSIEIPTSLTSIAPDAFNGCINLVNHGCKLSYTTFTLSSLTTATDYTPWFYNYDNDTYLNVGDKISGLTPSTSYTYSCGLIINNIYCRTYYSSYSTYSFNVNVKGDATVTSIYAMGSHTKGSDVTVLGSGINIGGEVVEYNNMDSLTITNLDPNTDYTVYYSVNTKEGGIYSTSKAFTTKGLELTTQEAKPTSITSVRLIASTNCDATEGTGFEWRRYDAPEELPSSKVTCPVVNGELVGSLRGVKDDVYYKYRPYYTSSSGKTYYGDWIAFFTGDTNVYFEPEVRTYSDFAVTDNSVVVKGYALEGTDVITAQGFEYWKTGTTIKPSSTDDRKTINASGISMSATLANLDYNTTYKYRAFVTTANGTVYGDEVEFSTGDDPAGVGYIEMDSDEFAVSLRENPATGTAWVKISGTANDEVQYTITSMSGAVVATDRVMLDGEWNAIDLNCSAGMYLLTINDGVNVKTLRLIVK